MVVKTRYNTMIAFKMLNSIMYLKESLDHTGTVVKLKFPLKLMIHLNEKSQNPKKINKRSIFGFKKEKKNYIGSKSK